MDERDPVDESEYVYRRIPRAYYDSHLPIAVQGQAFRPSQSDTTGLSVFRAAFAQPTDTLVNVDPAKVKDYYVARISVGALKKLGLSVDPELSWPAYQANKQALKPVLVELAKLASTDIVHEAS